MQTNTFQNLNELGQACAIVRNRMEKELRLALGIEETRIAKRLTDEQVGQALVLLGWTFDERGNRIA